MESVRFECLIEKREPDQRRFWGRGYIHTTSEGQVEDASGDVIDTPEAQRELEEAFYGFVKQFRTGDAGHELFGAAEMIEGFVVTADKQAAGLFPEQMDQGIYVGFEAVDSDAGDVLWEGVKSKHFTQLSIMGKGTREPI